MQHVEVKVVENVATIVMDRPQAHNALSEGLINDLNQAFSDVHQEQRADAVVLTGKGHHFSSGVDLKALHEISEMEAMEAQQAWIESWSRLTELCENLLRFPKPVVAAVDGSAIGAGLAIALACDLIVMSHRGSLAANASERGLVGGVTAPLLHFRFGGAIAARMLLTGDPIEAEEAQRLGICCAVVESEQIWVTANAWAKRCTRGPRESVLATKRMLNESIGETLLTHLAGGALTGATICNTESAQEGIRAYVEKREPKWP